MIDGKGYISIEKTVWCGKCMNWEQYSKWEFTKQIKLNGWKRSKKHGWLCPDCSKN